MGLYKNQILKQVSQNAVLILKKCFTNWPIMAFLFLLFIYLFTNLTYLQLNFIRHWQSGERICLLGYITCQAYFKN